MAAGLALNLAVDPDALAAVYVDFYSNEATDVTVQLDENGLVETITTFADISGLYGRVFDPDNGLDLGMSDAELVEAAEAFADTEWTVESRLTYTPEEDLVVEPAPETSDDRTEQWRDFLVASGVLDD